MSYCFNSAAADAYADELDREERLEEIKAKAVRETAEQLRRQFVDALKSGDPEASVSDWAVGKFNKKTEGEIYVADAIHYMVDWQSKDTQVRVLHAALMASDAAAAFVNAAAHAWAERQASDIAEARNWGLS